MTSSISPPYPLCVATNVNHLPSRAPEIVLVCLSGTTDGRHQLTEAANPLHQAEKWTSSCDRPRLDIPLTSASEVSTIYSHRLRPNIGSKMVRCKMYGMRETGVTGFRFVRGNMDVDGGRVASVTVSRSPQSPRDFSLRSGTMPHDRAGCQL
jgi:hypothetical protein